MSLGHDLQINIPENNFANGDMAGHSPLMAAPHSPLYRTRDKRSHSDAFNEDPITNLWKATPLGGKNSKKIRLLKLHGGVDDRLEANLIVRDDEKLQYEALSYTWGGEKQTSQIRIISGDVPYPVPITPNLQQALKHLRHKKQPRLLWIDALCINQNDLNEKNLQVPKMATIFNDATNVCVWLGVGNEHTNAALSLIRRILNLTEFEALIEDDKNEETTDSWKALVDVMKSRWFGRRWVIQEIALARKATVHCGYDSVLWNDFAKAVALFGSRYHQIGRLFLASSKFDHRKDYLGDVTSYAAYHLVKQSANLFRKSDDGKIQEHLLPLEYLVSVLSPFSATKAHDTVYAVLSLAEDTGARFSVKPAAAAPQEVDEILPVPNDPARLTGQDETRAKETLRALKKAVDDAYPVDYNKAFFEVCKDFIKFTVRTSRSLDILCRPWAPASSGEDLPSWIPMLSGTPVRRDTNVVLNRVRADTFVGLPVLGKRNYNAARKIEFVPTRVKIGQDISNRSLLAEGFILDRIAVKTTASQQGNVPYAWLELADWKDAIGEPPGAFWRTLIGDRGADGENPPLYYELACAQAFALRAAEDDLNTQRLIDTNSTSKAIAQKVVVEYLQRVQSIVWKRRLMRTQTHNALGLVPEKAKKKDYICILAGCSVPVVLRKITVQSRDESYYTLVGECYVHGMMDGEAARIQMGRKIPTQTFELR